MGYLFLVSSLAEEYISRPPQKGNDAQEALRSPIGPDEANVSSSLVESVFKGQMGHRLQIQSSLTRRNMTKQDGLSPNNLHCIILGKAKHGISGAS